MKGLILILSFLTASVFNLNANPGNPWQSKSASAFAFSEFDIANLKSVIVATAADRAVLKPYPNPATEYISVKTSDEFKLNAFEIYNALGVKVLTFESFSKEFATIEVKDLPKGVYLIRQVSEKDVIAEAKFEKY